MCHFSCLSSSVHAVFIAATCAICTTGCGQHTVPSPDKIELSAPVSVAMEAVGGLPVVSVRINGRGPFKLILDTGATGPVFGESLVREIGLPSLGQAAMGRPGSKKPMQATITRVEKLEIGGLTVEGMMGVFADVSSVLKKAPGTQGVLSVSIFQGLLITYNYPEKKIEFRRGALPAKNDESIWGWSAGQLPSFTADVAGQSVRMDLDTGSARGFVIDAAIAKNLEWLEAPSEGAKVRTVEVETKSLTGRMKGVIRVGKFSFEDPRLSYHDGFNNVGSAVLKDFVVTLDPKNHRLELKRE